jgi:D-alanyl-D-alanine carboxypeptidase (penicillin-binding protein 5/6)
MAAKPSFLHNFRSLRPAWRCLMAATVAVAIGCVGAVYAANNSVQGTKKEDHAFDGDAPTAILM